MRWAMALGCIRKKKLSKRPLEHGWHTSNATRNTLVRLAYDNVAGPKIVNPYRYDADCVFLLVSALRMLVTSRCCRIWSCFVNVTPTRTPTRPPLSQTGTRIATGSGASATTSKRAWEGALRWNPAGGSRGGLLLLADLL
jgi:hypothetical protein